MAPPPSTAAMRLPLASFVTALLSALLLTGCATSGGKWPSLAPRPGEAAPMVPRPSLACATCAPPAETPAAAARPQPPVPADAEARLAAIASDIDRVEAAVPAARQAVERATAAAAGQAADSNAGAAADIARSRWLELFVPLAGAERGLDRLDDDLAGTAAQADFAPRLAALRDRLSALTAARDALP